MKKAQFWYGDFLVAVLILMMIGLLFVSSIIDITSRNEILKELVLDVSDISSVLMSEGYGTLDDWNTGKGTIGLITDYKFDDNKFRDLISLSYSQQKSMLGTFNHVWIYLADKDKNIQDSNTIKIQNEILEFEGSVDYISEISNNLVHIKRFVFYNNNIYILGVVVWK